MLVLIGALWVLIWVAIVTATREDDPIMAAWLLLCWPVGGIFWLIYKTCGNLGTRFRQAARGMIKGQ